MLGSFKLVMYVLSLNYARTIGFLKLSNTVENFLEIHFVCLTVDTPFNKFDFFVIDIRYLGLPRDDLCLKGSKQHL